MPKNKRPGLTRRRRLLRRAVESIANDDWRATEVQVDGVTFGRETLEGAAIAFAFYPNRNDAT